jgi:glycosyltransferase involved in cell wall biosynthesis
VIKENKKIALIHDYLLGLGGAERVFKNFAEIYEEAPIYTLLYDEKKMGELFPKERVVPSFLQGIPVFLRKRHKYLGWLMPSAIENFDFRDFDVIISSSAGFSKGAVIRPQTLHICYCHSPARFLWDYQARYLEEQDLGPIKRRAARFLTHYLRVWDVASTDRPDFLIANSESTRERIQKYWRRDAEVIHPPFKDSVFNLKKDFGDNASEEKDYFLMVCRLSPYKKARLAVEVFNKMKLPLVIIGSGPERDELMKIKGSTVKIVDRPLSETELKAYYHNALAFLMPQEEDFGIAAVEAMACGKPVLAYGEGGAKETIKDGVSGGFFYGQSPEVLADAVRNFIVVAKNFDPKEISSSVERFSEDNFKQKIAAFVASCAGEKETL